MRTATSCEPLRSTAYSDDLRWKVVWHTGDVSKQLRHSESNKLSDPAKMFILNLIVCSPGIYLREIRKELRFLRHWC